MTHAALRIEKRGTHFRFLCSVGSVEAYAFREALNGEFSIAPEYAGIFAIGGWASQPDPLPAYFDSFSQEGIICNK